MQDCLEIKPVLEGHADLKNISHWKLITIKRKRPRNIEIHKSNVQLESQGKLLKSNSKNLQSKIYYRKIRNRPIKRSSQR